MWGTILVRLKILEGHIGLELFSPCTLSYNQGVPFCLLFFLHLANCIFREKLLVNPFAKRISSFCNGRFLA